MNSLSPHGTVQISIPHVEKGRRGDRQPRRAKHTNHGTEINHAGNDSTCTSSIAVRMAVFCVVSVSLGAA